MSPLSQNDHASGGVSLFEPHKAISARALYLGQRILTKSFDGAEKLAELPLVVKAGVAGYAVLFRFGVVVMFNLNPMEEVSFTAALAPYVAEPIDMPEVEFTQVAVEPASQAGISPGGIRLRDGTVEELQILADILAKSVTMAYYENSMARIVEQIEPVASSLHKKAKMKGGTRQLMNNIGQTLLIHSKMSGHVQPNEKPDILWERPDLERFYMMLANEYEISERFTILKQKLDLVHQTAETLLGIVSAKRTLHVEWYIVLLILFDIVMSLIEKAS